MDITIIIPLLNEEESLTELHDWICRVLDKEKRSYEIIFVDDGSTDASWARIENLANEYPNSRGIRFSRTLVSHKLYMQDSFKQREGSFYYGCRFAGLT